MVSFRMMQKTINSYDFGQNDAKQCKFNDFCQNDANNNVNSYDFCQEDAKNILN